MTWSRSILLACFGSQTRTLRGTPGRVIRRGGGWRMLRAWGSCIVVFLFSYSPQQFGWRDIPMGFLIFLALMLLVLGLWTFFCFSILSDFVAVHVRFVLAVEGPRRVASPTTPFPVGGRRSGMLPMCCWPLGVSCVSSGHCSPRLGVSPTSHGL